MWGEGLGCPSMHGCRCSGEIAPVMRRGSRWEQRHKSWAPPSCGIKPAFPLAQLCPCATPLLGLVWGRCGAGVGQGEGGAGQTPNIEVPPFLFH